MKLLIALLIGLVSGQQTFANGLDVELTVKPDGAQCSQVKGLIAGSKIRLEAKVKGKKVRAKYLFSISNEGFVSKPNELGYKVHEIDRGGKNHYTYELPNLETDRPWILTNFSVSVVTSKGQGFATVQLPVSRKFILREKDSTEVCRQVYRPRPITGLQLNQNDSDQTINISQIHQQISEETYQKSKGWSFSPTVFSNGWGLSLFGFHRDYLRSRAKSVITGYEVEVNNTLNPGDAGFAYVQYTRIKVPYDVDRVDQCGNQTYAGEAYLDHWFSTFNLVKVLPDDLGIDAQPYYRKSYGEEITNSCQALDQLAQISVEGK